MTRDDASGEWPADLPADGERFAVPVDAVQPSQLYLNGRKLALCSRWFDFDDPGYDPLPVAAFDGHLALTDGHTRAFLAHLSGADRLRVCRETDDVERDLYATCVEWCREAGVTTVADLAGRVVSAPTFEEEWVARCRAAAESE